MSITNDPLLTDIFEMVRVKMAAVAAITTILGSSPLRVYRNTPPGNTTYPVVIMTNTSKLIFNEDYKSVLFNIQLVIMSKSDNKTNQDILDREITTLFQDPDTCYNQDNTKIEKVNVTGGGSEFFDRINRTRMLPIFIEVLARRKTNL